MSFLEISGVSKSYGEGAERTDVLDDINLKVDEGEFIAIVGFSGSGTVLAPYLGAKIAWRALGDPRGNTAYARTTLATSPLYPGGTPHFLQPAELWYRYAIDTTQNISARL